MARKRMISDADGLADAIAGTVDVDLEQEDDEAEAEHEHDEEGPKVVCVYTYAPWEKSCVAFKESEAFAELEAQLKAPTKLDEVDASRLQHQGGGDNGHRHPLAEIAQQRQRWLSDTCMRSGGFANAQE